MSHEPKSIGQLHNLTNTTSHEPCAMGHLDITDSIGQCTCHKVQQVVISIANLVSHPNTVGAVRLRNGLFEHHELNANFMNSNE